MFASFLSWARSVSFAGSPRCLQSSSFREGGNSKAKADNPPAAKEFETRITRILTNRMTSFVEIGAIRVYASAFCVFSGVSCADKRPLRIIHVNESPFQIRLIRVIRG